MARKCRRCLQLKPDDLFGVDKSRSDNRAPYCRECRNLFERKQRKKGLRKGKPKKTSPEKSREYALRCRYNLEIEEYNNLLGAQNFSCGICATKLKTPCVDHEHETGVVRGILCRMCNMGIGALRDNINLLHKAVDYLTKFETGHKEKTHGSKKS